MPTSPGTLFLLSLPLFGHRSLEWIGMFLKSLKTHLFEEGQSNGVEGENLKT